MNDNDWDLAGWSAEFPFVSAVFLASSLEIATQLLTNSSIAHRSLNSSIVHRLKLLSQEKPDIEHTIDS